jgi:hypothetical protein
LAPTTTKLVSGSADSLSGDLDADGFTTSSNPFAPVSGAAPPAYDDRSKVAYFNTLYDLTPSVSNELSLQMQAADMVNSAEQHQFAWEAAR